MMKKKNRITKKPYRDVVWMLYDNCVDFVESFISKLRIFTLDQILKNIHYLNTITDKELRACPQLLLNLKKTNTVESV